LKLLQCREITYGLISIVLLRSVYSVTSCLPVSYLAVLCCVIQQWVDMSQYYIVAFCCIFHLVSIVPQSHVQRWCSIKLIKSYSLESFTLHVLNNLQVLKIKFLYEVLSESSRTSWKKKCWLKLLNFGCLLLQNSLLRNIYSDPIIFYSL
jgi:hypothetical protein